MFTLLLGLAFAQDIEVPALNAQLYRAPIDARHTLWTDSSGTSTGNFGMARLAVGYTSSPLVFQAADGSVTDIVGDVLGANAIVGYNVGRLRIGADLPVYMAATSDVASGGAGIGDVALDARVNLLDPEDGFGLALGGRTTLPTLSLDVPLGDPGLGWEAQLIGELRPVDEAMVGFNVGYRGTSSTALPGLTLDDALFVRVGGGYEYDETYGVSGDIVAHLSPGAGSAYGNPAEAMVGFWYRATEDVAVRFGAGTGISPGIGAPAARAVGMLSYEPQPSRDRDNDGLGDKYDQCPDVAEDIDGFDDIDGCPDPDNDQDGVLDRDDDCPDMAEDVDGFQDNDGCPDVKTKVHVRAVGPDGYLVPGSTMVIMQPDTGFKTIKGGADLEIELHPGLYMVQAASRGWWPGTFELIVRKTQSMESEFELEPVDQMGTVALSVFSPEGIEVDATWEVSRGAAVPVPLGHTTGTVVAGDHIFLIRADGAAPLRLPVTVEPNELTEVLAFVRPPRVQLIESDQLILLEGQIEFGRIGVREESYVLLDEIADWVIDHPEKGTLVIEVHTDSRGSNSLNLKTSRDRAEAVVNYLVSSGVDRGRLVMVGKGEEEPLDPSGTEAAWDTNRRVEFWFREPTAEELEGNKSP